MIEQEHPIAAVATSLAPAALAVIRTSGEGAIELVSSLFSRSEELRSAPGHSVVYGDLRTTDGTLLDEVLITVFRAPRSYTGEDAAEISCHGSPAGVRRIYAALLDAGFSAAEPGEFTRRAFVHGKLDLTQAEAVNEIVRAQTTAAHTLALDRLGGAVREALATVRASLVQLMAQLSIQLDYPEEDSGEVALDTAALVQARDRVESLAETFARGQLFQEGVRVAFAGRTNAGKSSLFNHLLGSDRSIVSETHGTTRDYLEAMIDVDGIPVRLFDTAGLRAAAENVEEEGIRRSRQIIQEADLVLYAIDADGGEQREDRDRIDEIAIHTPVVPVFTKSDLCRERAEPEHRPDSRSESGPPLLVSAHTGAGIPELLTRLRDTLRASRGVSEGGGLAIDSERQHAALIRAADALRLTEQSAADRMPADTLAVDLQEALDAIGEITGEVASAEILDQMFGNFCVGK
jgi:tRNA modification GTPase